MKKLLHAIRNKLRNYFKRAVRAYYTFAVKRYLQLTPNTCPICGNTENFTTLVPVDRYGITVPKQRCGGCGLVMANPRPTEGFLDKFYRSKMYRGLYRGVLRFDPGSQDKALHAANQHISFLSKHCRFHKDFSVLDIGSSGGTFLIKLKEEKPSIKITGIEPGASFNYFYKENLDDFFETIDDVPMNKTFDLITMWHVLEHMVDPVDTLVKIKKHLKADGVLVVEVPNLQRYEGIRNFHLAHIYDFDEKTIRALFNRAGFTSCEIHYDDLQDERFGMKVVVKKS